MAGQGERVEEEGRGERHCPTSQRELLGPVGGFRVNIAHEFG
jgi:hypothetical protein